jgi:hypothetical protein
MVQGDDVLERSFLEFGSCARPMKPSSHFFQIWNMAEEGLDLAQKPLGSTECFDYVLASFYI